MENLVASEDIYGIQRLLCSKPELVGKTLQEACDTGKMSVVDMLVSLYHVDVSIINIIPAVCSGDVGMIEFLVDQGASVDGITNTQDSPLETACRYGHSQIVDYMLRKGAKYNIVKCLFLTVSKFSCSISPEDTSTVEVLLSVFTNNNKNVLDRMLMLACDSGRLEIAKFIVSEGASVTSPIRAACGSGHLQVVQWLVESGADVRAMDNQPILLASANDHLEVVRYLVKVGADRSRLVHGSRSERYLTLLDRTYPKIRDRAQKKIYFWWIPICYDTTRECGMRMRDKNWKATCDLFESRE